MLVVLARAVRAIDQSAIPTGITRDLDSKVQWCVRNRVVLRRRGDGQPGLAVHVLTHSEVRRSPVAHVRTIGAPSASLW